MVAPTASQRLARALEHGDILETVDRLIRSLELTALGDAETSQSTALLCERAVKTVPPLAGVCIWPQFVEQARRHLGGTELRVVTVTNFPHGGADIEQVRRECFAAVAAGANEIDIVMPYRAWLAGNRGRARELTAACKAACGQNALLKVILETGALAEPELIRQATRDVIDGGADFVKTSTGKLGIGATYEAAEAILQAIGDWLSQGGRPIGIKVAGGIATMEDASRYLGIADSVMGRGWANPGTFRIGASRLLDDLLRVKLMS